MPSVTVPVSKQSYCQQKRVQTSTSAEVDILFVIVPETKDHIEQHRV